MHLDADKLIQLLLLADSSKHCAGNPDDCWFGGTYVSHKAKNQQGLLYIASYIANYIHAYIAITTSQR